MKTWMRRQVLEVASTIEGVFTSTSIIERFFDNGAKNVPSHRQVTQACRDPKIEKIEKGVYRWRGAE